LNIEDKFNNIPDLIQKSEINEIIDEIMSHINSLPDELKMKIIPDYEKQNELETNVIQNAIEYLSDKPVPLYYSITINYKINDVIYYSDIISFNAIKDINERNEMALALEYLYSNVIDHNIINNEDVSIKLTENIIYEIAKKYKDYITRTEFPFIQGLNTINLTNPDSVFIYDVEYSLNLIYNNSFDSVDIPAIYTKLYCYYYEKDVLKLTNVSEGIKLSKLHDKLPEVYWVKTGPYNTTLPIPKKQLVINKMLFIAKGLFPTFESKSKIPTMEIILKQL